jgi:voltage-gated potassium channel
MFERLQSKQHQSKLWSWVPGAWSNALTTIGLLAMVMGTSRTAEHRLLFITVVVVWGCIAAAFGFQLWKSFAKPKPKVYLTSNIFLIDLVATIALPIGWLLVPDPGDAQLFAVVWALRYFRHSPSLTLFGRVMHRSRTAIMSLAGLFFLIFLVTASLAYAFERNVQPEAFGSIPLSMWWAIVTLTTTGYGNQVPATAEGQMLAGSMMVCGIVMFALLAGIIATAFAEELRRRHFLHTWDLVKAVSFFQGLRAAVIADIVSLLQSIEVNSGTVVVREGDPGDAMYFIVSGEATVQQASNSVVLGPGSFFGEMALLFDATRSATVIATKPSVLLVLDVTDFRLLASRRPEVIDAIETEGKRRREENTPTA